MKSTTNYGMFKTIEGNRIVNQNHVKRLAAAIEKRNLLAEFPIVINEQSEVIDGQHRLLAAAELGIPVWYEQVEGLNIRDVTEINTTARPWTLVDFIDSFIALGKTDYQELKDFMLKWEIGPANAAVLLMGAGSTGQIGPSQVVKEGKFQSNRPERAAKCGQLLSELRPYAEFNPTGDRALIRTLNICFDIPAFDPDRLVAKLKAHGMTLRKRGNIRYYLLEIEEMYNFRARLDANLVIYQGQA